MHRLRHDHVALAIGDVDRHQHRFSYRGATFVETGICDIHAGELANERLVFEECLQAPLARFGLIWRVSGVKLAAAGDGVDDSWNEMVVAAPAEEADALRRRL